MKILILLIAVLSCTSCFAQSKENQVSDYDKYMKNKKTYNTAGWCLAGTGGALVIRGLVIENYGSDNTSIGNSPGIYYYIGGLAALSSVPFFIVAHSNKKKALKVQEQPQSTLVPGKFKSLPGLTLSVSLGNKTTKKLLP